MTFGNHSNLDISLFILLHQLLLRIRSYIGKHMKALPGYCNVTVMLDILLEYFLEYFNELSFIKLLDLLLWMRQCQWISNLLFQRLLYILFLLFWNLTPIFSVSQTFFYDTSFLQSKKRQICIYYLHEPFILKPKQTNKIRITFHYLERILLTISTVAWMLQMVVVAENSSIDKKLCKTQENFNSGLNLVFPLTFCTGLWNSLMARVFKNRVFQNTSVWS